MPWERRTVEEQRREFAEAAMRCTNFSALCREYGIDRHTGYKWKARYAAGQPLADESRRPHTSPNRTPEATERRILEMRAENPGWGARTIHHVLQRRGEAAMPCVKTVNNILKRNGCISPEESQKRKPFVRFEKEKCNMLWQTDFKGEFKMADGRYCYPLTAIDDHSRFALCVAPNLSTKNVVIGAFEGLFREFGLPDAILSDNGAQFSGFRRGYTQFERWLMELDVLPVHGRIAHPQTQGKIERFHRTMKQELLKHTTLADIDDARLKLGAWRRKYNEERPHEALGMRTPSQVYERSGRSYSGRVEPFSYGGGFHVIKVNSWGYVRFDRWQVYLSETMIGRYIEFRPAPDGETFFACYRNFRIAEFDAADGKLLHRRISRL